MVPRLALWPVSQVVSSLLGGFISSILTLSALFPAAPSDSELGASTAPAQPLFGFQSPFDDLLGAPSSPAQVKDAVSQPSAPLTKPNGSDKKPTTEPGAAPTSQLIDTNDPLSLHVPVPDSRKDRAQATPSPSSSSAAQGPPAKSEKETSAAASSPILPASKHLAALHQRGAFNSSETSGLQTDRISHDTTLFRLDLAAAQPGGLASLHPAKLETKPLSAVEFTFADSATPVYGPSAQAELPAPLIAQIPVPQVAHLGTDIIAYSMKKGRVRVLHSVTGDRLLLQAEGHGKIRSLSASTGTSEGKAETWYVSTIHQPKGKEGRQVFTVWKVWLQDRLDCEIVATGDVEQWYDGTNPMLSCEWAPSASAVGCQKVFLTCGAAKSEQVACCFKQIESSSSQHPSHTVKMLELRQSQSSSAQDQVVASSLSGADGCLAGVVTRASDTGAFTLCLTHDRDGPNVHEVPIADLPSEVFQHIPMPTITSLVLIQPKDSDCPRAALMGFQSNTVVGLYDLQNRQWRFVWSFGQASSDSNLNVVAFDPETSSVAITNEQRSSLFNIQLKFDDLPKISQEAKNSDKHILMRRLVTAQLPWTVRVAPFVDEFALQEPLISFAIARGPRPSEPGMKVFAIFPSGAQTLMVPPVQRASTYLTWQASPSAKLEPVSTQGVSPISDSDPGGPSVGNATAQNAPVRALAVEGNLSSSDSDLDGPLVMLKSQRLKAARGGVREQEEPAEWDAGANAFSQLVSSETSTPASPMSKPSKARQTDSPGPKKGTRGASQGKKVSEASDAKHNGVRATPPAVESPQAKSAVSETAIQPPAKTILTRAARQWAEDPSDAEATAIREAIKAIQALDDKVTNMTNAERATPASASAGTPHAQLSAAALSAIASEVGAAVSGEISGALTPQLLEAVRASTESALRLAFAQDLQGVLPNEFKKVVARSDVGDALAKSISQGVIPVVQKTAMDVVSRVLAPHFEETILGLTQSIEARVDSSMAEVRSALVAGQSASLKTTEQQLNAMTTTLARVLTKVEALSSQNESLQATVTELRSSGLRGAPGVPDLASSFGHRPPPTPSAFHYPSGHHAPPHQHSYGYIQAPQHTGGPWQAVEPFISPAMSHHHLPHRPSTSQRGFPPFGGPPPAATPPLFGYSSSATPAPAAAPPSVPPPPVSFASAAPPPPSLAGHGSPPEEVEDALLSALSAAGEGQAELQLSTLLPRLQAQHGRPDLALRLSDAGATPVGGTRGTRLTVSQPVLLTLLHRLSKSIGKGNGVIPLETAIPWAEATAASLNVEDATIAPAYAVVAGNIRQSLIDAWQAGSLPWWTDDRLQNHLIRYLK